MVDIQRRICCALEDLWRLLAWISNSLPRGTHNLIELDWLSLPSSLRTKCADGIPRDHVDTTCDAGGVFAIALNWVLVLSLKKFWEKKMLVFVTAREKSHFYQEGKDKRWINFSLLSCLLFRDLFWRKLCNAWPSWMLTAVLVPPPLLLKSLTSPRLTERLTEQTQNIYFLILPSLCLYSVSVNQLPCVSYCYKH